MCLLLHVLEVPDGLLIVSLKESEVQGCMPILSVLGRSRQENQELNRPRPPVKFEATQKAQDRLARPSLTPGGG